MKQVNLIGKSKAQNRFFTEDGQRSRDISAFGRRH